MSQARFGLVMSGPGGSMADFARKTEGLGYDSLWTGEHIFRTGGEFFDTVVVLAACAAVTSRVRLGTAILLLPLKHPVLVSKAVTTLDHLSNGRASLGIGIGGENPREFEALGVPVNERGPRASESLEIIRRLWTEDNVTYDGRFFRFKEVTLEPKPVQKPHPPILVAGRREGSLRRTARLGDGWMPYLYTPEMYRANWAKIEEQALKAGRDPGAIERTLFAFICVAGSYEEAARTASKHLGLRYRQPFDSLVHKYAIVGTPEQCASRLAEFSEAGVQHFIFAWTCETEDIGWHVETVAREIAPRLRGQRT